MVVLIFKLKLLSKDVFRDLQDQYNAILKTRKQAAEEQPAPQDLEEVNK